MAACRAGFTQLELLVVVAIIAVVLGLLVPAIAAVRRSARSASCLAKLHQIAGGFQHYALDNGGRLPDPLSADASWETTIWEYVRAPGVFQCPADEELAPAVGSSYDWRDTGDPTTTLAGRPIEDRRGANVVLAHDSLPDWHEAGTMNAVRVDGSATTMDAQECLTDLMTPIRTLPGLLPLPGLPPLPGVPPLPPLP